MYYEICNFVVVVMFIFLYVKLSKCFVILIVLIFIGCEFIIFLNKFNCKYYIYVVYLSLLRI